MKYEPPPPLQEEKIVINIYENIKYDLSGEQITELSGPKINQTEWFSEFIRSFQSENLKKKK